MNAKRPNTIESLILFSGHYDWRKDFRLSMWLVVAALSYGAGRTWVDGHPDAAQWLELAVLLFPLLPLLEYIRYWVRFMNGLDELQRRMQLSVWLFAAMGTVIAGAIVATLNDANVSMGVLSGGLGIGGGFLVMISLWTLGSVIAIRRYR